MQTPLSDPIALTGQTGTSNLTLSRPAMGHNLSSAQPSGFSKLQPDPGSSLTELFPGIPLSYTPTPLNRLQGPFRSSFCLFLQSHFPPSQVSNSQISQRHIVLYLRLSLYFFPLFSVWPLKLIIMWSILGFSWVRATRGQFPQGSTQMKPLETGRLLLILLLSYAYNLPRFLQIILFVGK